MLVRKAVVADAGAIASVHVDSWRTTYKDIFPQEFLNKLSCDERAERWERNIAEQHVFVAENNQGEIVGFSTGGKERTGRYENY
ncbi:GNAT family N-acetyltransferase [Virgibacillus dakarensis]